VVWVCENHLGLAHIVGREPRAVIRGIESEAAVAAGDRAGAYLDGLGKTDLAELTVDEWRTFVATIINGFGEEMRDRLGAKAAPARGRQGIVKS
jgi:hypothetical protein